MDVWRYEVPELGSRERKGSAPHGAEADRGNSEVDRKERTGRAGMREIGPVGRIDALDGLECVQIVF